MTLFQCDGCRRANRVLWHRHSSGLLTRPFLWCTEQNSATRVEPQSYRGAYTMVVSGWDCHHCAQGDRSQVDADAPRPCELFSAVSLR